METEKRNSSYKTSQEKMTFNKLMLSFKEQTDWPWKAFLERRESFNVSSKSSEKLFTANIKPRKTPI